MVRSRRDELGWSQAELGERVGRSQRWVSTLEAGEIAVPRRQLLHRLAEVLSVDLADLYVAADLARTQQEARNASALSPLDEDSSSAADDLCSKIRRLNLTFERISWLNALLDSMAQTDKSGGDAK